MTSPLRGGLSRTALTRRPFCCWLPGNKVRGGGTEGGWAWGQRRTRCKYVHVSSMAPSMAPTVLRCPMPIRFKHCLRLLLPPGSREKKDQIQRQKPKPQCPLLLLLPPWVRCVRARRNLSREAGRAAQDREAHGCADRAYMDVFTACPAQPARPPHTHQSRRVKPQPRALLGFTRFPKKIALISSRSVPCQYLRCAGSSANSTTLPCPCADTSNHALPATRVRLRSDR